VSESNDQRPGEQHDQFHKRDAETQMVLGAFVTIISIPVLIGTFWANTYRAAVVNLVAGAVLMAIGLGIAWYGWKKKTS